MLSIPFVGEPERVASMIEELAINGNLNSFLFIFPDFVEELAKFNAQVMPLLRQRGLERLNLLRLLSANPCARASIDVSRAAVAVMSVGSIAERVAPLLRQLLAPVALVAAAICFVPLARASLLVTNATFLTMKPGETAPVVGYMLVGNNGRIAALAASAPPVGMERNNPRSTPPAK